MRKPGKKFAASAGALVAAVALGGLVGQVPSSAAVQPHSAQVACDGTNPPSNYNPDEQFNAPNECGQCQAHKFDVGPGRPTYCEQQNSVQAILWYGPHLG